MTNKNPYSRIMIKLSGEALLGNRSYGISNEASLNIAKELKLVWETGMQVSVVIGGGNIFRGLSASHEGFDRATADYMGMLATVMNALALQDALLKTGVDVRVQSALQMNSVAEPFIRRKAMRHMEKGRVVMIAAGTGDPYVTTDTGAALHALELHCELLVKATQVDGVYDKDPNKEKNAKRFTILNFQDAITLPEVRVMDNSALSLCMENNLPVKVVKLFNGGSLLESILSPDLGTLIVNNRETAY